MDNKNITIIGIGRLGLCFGLVLSRKGYNVLGVDINESYIKQLNNKSFRSPEPKINEYLTSDINFKATTDLQTGIEHSKILFILVDTPSSGNKQHYDHSNLGNVLLELNKRKISNKHIVIGCTVIPGYIRNVATYLIKDTENCSLSYNPEFIAQGNIINGQLRPDMVLIGEGSLEAGNILQTLYENMTDNTPTICRMSTESAEICKLGVNCFVTMKITFANLMGDIADKTQGANKLSIMSAIGQDSRIGEKCLRPGYGFGGPCFPRDNRALGGFAETVGIDALLFKATDAYNAEHTHSQIQELLNENKTEYVFRGVAYKADTRVPIVEESQRLIIAAELAKAGKIVTIQDYPETIKEVKKLYGNLFIYEILPMSK